MERGREHGRKYSTSSDPQGHRTREKEKQLQTTMDGSSHGAAGCHIGFHFFLSSNVGDRYGVSGL